MHVVPQMVPAFCRLWNADTAGYASQSEADMALCCHLAFWTGKDASRMDSLFRQSGLYRDKWERQDYRERTIAKAIERTTETYNPGQPYAAREANYYVNDVSYVPATGANGTHGSEHSSESDTESGATEQPNASPHSSGANSPDPLKEEAFYGLAGEWVRMVEPHTEADPVALLIQFLTAFGNLVGRGPHYLAEADRHYSNLFIVLVGQTPKGRKGTSLGQVQAIFSHVDQEWCAGRVMGGLSSGEGLIWASAMKYVSWLPSRRRAKSAVRSR
jgi:hypothetical protein